MKKILEKAGENKFLYFAINMIAMTIMAMILWPFFDFIFAKIIPNREFAYSVDKHIIEPIFFGIILSLIYTVMRFKKKNK